MMLRWRSRHDSRGGSEDPHPSGRDPRPSEKIRTHRGVFQGVRILRSAAKTVFKR